jgi:hypothetical protein
LKKLAAILLLCLFAFNWFGYRLFMDVLEQQANKTFQAKLDKDQYETAGLIEVRIPLNLPYVSNWSSFERYEGQTEINGVHYNYVKRRLINDTLILLCISNDTRNELRTAKTDIFKQVNDLQTPNKKTNSSSDPGLKYPLNDYLLNENTQLVLMQVQLPAHHALYLNHFSSLLHLVQEQPPDC